MKTFVYKLIAAFLFFVSTMVPLFSSSGVVTVSMSTKNRVKLLIIGPEKNRAADSLNDGQSYEYNENDGHFAFDYQNGKLNNIDCYFAGYTGGRSGGDYWYLNYSQPKCKIVPGLYENTCKSTIDLFTGSTLLFAGCDFQCNGYPLGDINIIEIEFDRFDEIKSLAVNILEYCALSCDPPIFAALRVNSNVPIEATVKEIFENSRGTPNSYFYSRNCNQSFSAQSLKTTYPKTIDNITSNCSEFEYSTYYDQKTGTNTIDIAINQKRSLFSSSILAIETLDTDNKQENGITMTFSTANENGFEEGLHETVSNIENQGKYPQNYLSRSNGNISNILEYNVLAHRVDSSGNIIELALDFIAISENGEIFEGSIRYDSNVPINLEWPFSKQYTGRIQGGRSLLLKK